MLKNKLFKDSYIYFFSQIVNKAIPFLLLPIITRYLSPEEYGIVVSFTAFLTFAIIFVGINLNSAINVNYFKVSHEEMKIYVFNALIILIISALISNLLILMFGNLISLKIGLSTEWIFLAIGLAFFKFITLINLGLWQAEQKAKAYGMYEISQTLLISFLILFSIYILEMKWKGIILATAIGTFIFALVSFIFLIRRKYISIEFSKKDSKDLLSFGIPMIPHQLSGWILLQYDKIFIVSMLGLSAAGIYAVGAQIGMVISLITLAVNKAWAPYLYKKLSSNISLKEKIKIVKFTYLYFISLLILAFCIMLLSPWIINIYLGEKYTNATQFVGYIAFAFAFNGMYFMVVNYIFYMKKTHILAGITFLNSIIYIVISYILLKEFGAIGVACAVLISYFLSFIFVWKASNTIYPMPWMFWKYNE